VAKESSRDRGQIGGAGRCLFDHLGISLQKMKIRPRPDSHGLVLWNAVVPPNYFARAMVKKRDFSMFSRRFRLLQKS
jgi:hypothetical protein